MRLRQLVFVSRERDELGSKICKLLDLKESYNDAGLINFGLENVLIPLGDTFFEIVTPVKENTTAERFLDKKGGDGGYMVIVDVENFEEEQERVETSGIEIVWHGNREEENIQARTIHLHPKQVGAAILSIDHMNPKAAWLWAGTDWEKDINKQKIKKAIKDVSTKQFCALNNWTKENPDFQNSESKQNYYTHALVAIANNKENNEEKIIKKLCNNSYVKED